jgi:ABC-three component (ABC-3C) system Middle Component 5
MTRRLWYPQLDVYDAIRRIAGLLAYWDASAPPSQERLYIADFYLANPALLHQTHMTRSVRNEFNALGIERPEKSFVSYPSAPVLFQKMGEVQRQAFRTLAGKGLIDAERLAQGAVAPSETGRAVFADGFVPLLSDSERAIATFIARTFAAGESTEIGGLRRSTGLRRVAR